MRRFVILFAACLIASVGRAHSPYISRVWEYCPAPGQFVNILPAYEEGDNEEAMRAKAEEAIAENNRGMISLGGWGGYVVFGFDHMVENRADACDLLVAGNAIYSQAGDEEERQPGSAEPGIVMVSYDANGNGKPDDEWYELAGSEYANPLTIHSYSITYHRPSPDHQPTPSATNAALTDTTYLLWEDNQAGSGYLNQVTYHKQPYYPQWIESEHITFRGAQLPGNAEGASDASYYTLYTFPWGYADNHPNGDARALLDIDWAVTAEGEPAQLAGIHFVKVYTAIHQQCGWLGESSTEITGAEDIGMTRQGIESVLTPLTQQVYSITGMPLGNSLPQAPGVYIIRNGKESYKIIQL